MDEDLVRLRTPYLEEFLEKYLEVDRYRALELNANYAVQQQHFLQAALIRFCQATEEYDSFYAPFTLNRGAHLDLAKRHFLLSLSLASLNAASEEDKADEPEKVELILRTSEVRTVGIFTHHSPARQHTKRCLRRAN